jgi:hypothetical protein
VIFALLLWLQTATTFHHVYQRWCSFRPDVEACLQREPHRWAPCPKGFWTVGINAKDFSTPLPITVCVEKQEDIPFSGNKFN